MTGQTHPHKTLFIILIIICATLFCYANSFSVPFLWDDEVLILRNNYVKGLNYFWPIFTTGHFQGAGEGGNFYRPLQIISYSLDYFLWGFNPFGYHLTNIILHCLVGIFIYFLITKISDNNIIGFFSALFFAVHPVHTESVTYIAGRADSLFTVFLLSGLIVFIKIPSAFCARRYVYWISACFLYILALLSKENALIFLFLTLFYLLVFLPKRKIKSWMPIYVSLLIISGVYIFVRTELISFPPSRSLSLIAQAPWLIRLQTVPKIWLFYLGLLILPVSLHMERHFLVTALEDPYFWMGLVFLVISFLYLKLFWRRWRKICFYFGWFIIALIPVFNIVPLNATMAEHWLYLPSVGFWAMMATVGVKFFNTTFRRNKIIFVIFACLLFLFYCTRTIMRNYQWRSPIGLYAHDLQYSPNSFLLHNNYGVELFRRGEVEKAGKHFQAAITISPRYATSHNNLGVALENQGKIKEAIVHYKAAIKLNNYILAYGNLGKSYLKIGRLRSAQVILENGQRLYPLDTEISYCLAIAYFQQGKFSRAKKEFGKVSGLSPHYKATDVYLQKLENVSY